MAGPLDKLLTSLDRIGDRLSKLEKDTQIRNDAAALTRRARDVEKRAEQQRRADFSCRAIAARADEALAPWGRSAPRPKMDDTPWVFARTIANALIARLPQGHELKRVDCLTIRDDSAFKAIETVIYEEAAKAAVSNDSVPANTIEARSVVNAENGHRETHFVGNHSFVRDIGRPASRARLRTLNEVAGLQKAGVWK